MRKRTVFTWLAAVALLVLAAPPNTSSRAVAAPSSASKVLPGTVPPAVANAQDQGGLKSQNTLHLTFVLPVRNEQALQQFLQDVNNPSSPEYHHFLTQDQANQSFNPTAAQEQQVINWLQSSGLTVTHTYPNHLMIDVTGTVGKIESLLKISIHNFHGQVHGKPGDFFAPTSNPTVPSSVSSLLTSVVGLDDYPRFHIFSNGSADGSAPYFPQDFANAYDVNPLWNAGYTGSGQHIGITLWTVPPSDSTLQHYGSVTGASVATQANGRLKLVKVDGGTTTADDGEAGLDIESTSGMAPAATIDYYEAPTDSNGNPTNQGLLDALNLAGTDANNNQEISNSWGGCEWTANDAWQQSAETIFSTNAATGHNYFFSSGDNGSWCGPTPTTSGSDPWPDYPASSPNVTTVGGTKFSASISGSYPGEAAWAYCSTCNNGEPEGSGGGYSNIFSRPSWQTGTGLASNGKRGYPDISAVGDPNTGAYTCWGASSSCGQVGGTSLSSPLWAGMTALLNQYLAAQSKPALGFLDPVLYNLANQAQTYAPLHDVTSGGNGAFNAGSKWDAVTGDGTPDLYNIARDLAGGSGSGATNTPTATPTSSGSLTNGGFENGQAPWSESSGNNHQMVQSSQAHTGSSSAWLCGYTSCNDTLYQTITVPSSFTTFSVSFWVYITSPDTSCSGSLRLQPRTTSGVAISTVLGVCDSTITSGWVQKTVSLVSALSPYKGQQVQLAFVGNNSATHAVNYYIDDVAITSDGVSVLPTATSPVPPTATVTPLPTATSTPGSTSTPGPTATRTPTPTTTPVPTNTPVPTSTATPTGGGGALITNGGFENGQSPWTEQSGAGYQMVTASKAHSGSYSAWLCGYTHCNDTLYQTFTVPSSYTTLSLSFWLYITSPDISCSGSLRVQPRTTSGVAISTVLGVCDSTITSGWVQKTVSLASALSAYKGQQVQLAFLGSNVSIATSYYLDDVALTTDGSSSGSTATPVASPTPTRTAVPTATPLASPTKTSVPTATKTATPLPTATGTGASCPGSTTGCAQAMLNILNQDRTNNHVAALTLNMTQTNGSGSCVGSIGHSQAMQQSGQIWHNRNDNPIAANYPQAEFPTDICIAYSTAGENVGEASYGNELTDMQQLDSAMMGEAHDSNTCATTVNHACNIINPSFHQVGIGVIYVNNTTWLTEDFTN